MYREGDTLLPYATTRTIEHTVGRIYLGMQNKKVQIVKLYYGAILFRV
jgi:hypothetical protein